MSADKQYHSEEFTYAIVDIEYGWEQTIVGGPHEITWDKFEERYVIDVPSAFSCDSVHALLPHSGYVVRVRSQPIITYEVIWALELIPEMTTAYIWKEED